MTSGHWAKSLYYLALATALGLLAFSSGLAGTIETLDQKQYHGDLIFQPDKSVLVRTNGTDGPVLSWKQIARIRFRDVVEVRPGPDWRNADVGKVYFSGSTQLASNSLQLLGAGWGWWNATDAFRFTGVPLRGEGEIIAQVSSFHDSNGIVFAGVTLRGDLSPDAEHVTLFVSPEGKVRMKSRPAGSEPRVNRDGIYWVRLRRTKELVIGFISNDGLHWEPVEEVNAPAGAEVRAGVVTATVINAFLGGATFSNVVVHTSGSSGNLFNDLPATGVVLTDGTILAGKPEIRDQRILKLERNGKRSELPWNRIAVVLLRPASASIIQPGSAVRAGVMMAGSDFLEGEITSIATNSITLNSLLFGIKKINLDRRPVAILNAGVNRQSRRWEIRLTDESLIYCEEPSPTAEALTIGHPWLSSFVVKWDEIAEISSPARSTNEKSQ